MIEIQPGNTIAVLADIHGNSIALDAVLRSIAAQGRIDAWWFLGDYAAIGHDPISVLDTLRQIEKAIFIRGNTDRYLTQGTHPWPQAPDSIEDPALLSLYVRAGRSFAWTTGAIAASGNLDWFRSLPLDFEARLPDGTRVLAVHAAPGEDDGPGIHPGRSDAELSELVRGVPADSILVGHTHYPQDRTISGIRVVNPGSVSNPLPPDLGAEYALIKVGPRAYDLSFHTVDYDRDRVVAKARSVNHPAWEYIAQFMSGNNIPDWMSEMGLA